MNNIQQEDIKIGIIDASNIAALESIKWILTHIMEEIDSNTIVVGHFNHPT